MLKRLRNQNHSMASAHEEGMWVESATGRTMKPARSDLDPGPVDVPQAMIHHTLPDTRA